ncbi:MAG: nuclear transport factor 2 family protein [Kordiimonadaceae bacterium]|nr:nuclear transport factor 2 family protein [Kordiimonadaceae bacterium]
MTDALAGWHNIIKKRDPALLSQLLADDVVFYSPVVHAPQEGKGITTMYLSAAVQVLGNENFKYLAEYRSENGAVLEFETKIDDITVNGVDMIKWNDKGLITEFKVMIRPLKAMNKIHEMMGAMLKAMSKK